MRILHISTRLILGGSQENTVLSCMGQASRGHEVHLAFGPIYGPEGSMLETVRRFRMGDGRMIKTHEVPHMVRELNPVKDRRAYGELRGLIRSLKPDIVHTHSSKAGILGRGAAWSEGGAAGSLGVIHTVHGPPFHRYEKAWRNRIYIWSERWAAKRCHRIVSVADAMTNQFLERRIGRPEQYITIHSGMDLGPYLHPPEDQSRETVRAWLGLDESDIVLGTVARLAELKGHDDILDALGEDLRADPRLKLLWVGDGWWRERLTSRLEDLGLRDRVIMTGLVTPERVPGLIRAMDVLIHPSYREGLPRAVPQALLCGVPVVAYDVDGTSEACVDHKTGRLVRAGDIAGLREAVRWMTADPARARATAEAGREMCRQRFSAETMVNRLEELYADVLRAIRRGGSAGTRLR